MHASPHDAHVLPAGTRRGELVLTQLSETAASSLPREKSEAQ